MGARTSRGGRGKKSGGAGGAVTSGGLPSDTERQQLTWEVVGDRVFVKAEKKDAYKNWLEEGRAIPTVEATFDLNPDAKSVYLNRIDALISGKGFGIEVMRTALVAFAKGGFKKARGFVRFADADSQGMMSKLGGKVVEENKSGRYWEFEL